MKTIRFIVILLSAIFLSLNARSQNCTTCWSDTTILTPGFINLNAIPCIVQGEPYIDTIPFRMFPGIVMLGDTLNVDSVHLLDIENLPCGLCWSSNTYTQPYNTYTPNQTGCIAISGTSTDTTGQFKLAITFYGYFGHTGKPILPATLDTNGIVLILRVVSPTGTCPPADTSASALNQMSNPSLCSTGVKNIPGSISLFDVYPNPLTTDAAVSFSALQTGACTLKLMDVTGKTLQVQQLRAFAGINKTRLQRQNLPAGIYFISIGNEEGMITKKLIIED